MMSLLKNAICRSLKTAALGGIILSASPVAADDLQFNTAMLRGLDKVTARVAEFEASIGTAINFGTLQIDVQTCRKRPPEEVPETAAFLNITEKRPGEPASVLFRGWMFASSPALSALEHPVYDVWLVDCINKE